MTTKTKPGINPAKVAKYVANVFTQRFGLPEEVAGLTFSETTHRRQKLSVEDRRAGSGLKLGIFEELVAQLTRTPIEEPTPGVMQPPVDPVVLTAALQLKAPRDTGALSDSLEAVWADDHYDVYSHGIPYGRIQDLGGYTGKNHASLLAGHFYLAKAAAAVGLPDDLVQWAEVPDA